MHYIQRTNPVSKFTPIHTNSFKVRYQLNQAYSIRLQLVTAHCGDVKSVLCPISCSLLVGCLFEAAPSEALLLSPARPNGVRCRLLCAAAGRTLRPPGERTVN